MMESTEKLAVMVGKELDEIMNAFDIRRNNSKITTSSGKSYLVANVLKFKKDGDWEVTEAMTRGMFSCEFCPSERRDYPGSATMQVTRNGNVVRVSDKDMHQIENHPKEVSAKKVASIAAVMF